jgi:antirestriction protein ArdC
VPSVSTRRAGGEISRPLRSNSVAYQGINALILWLDAAERGYASPYYLTCRCVQNFGPGAEGREVDSRCLFQHRDQGERRRGNADPLARINAVFNAQQNDGLPITYYTEANDPLPEEARSARADEFIKNTGITVREEGTSAYSNRRDDIVTVPQFARFTTPDAFVATVLHELAHGTGYESRLAREFGKKFGDCK